MALTSGLELDSFVNVVQLRGSNKWEVSLIPVPQHQHSLATLSDANSSQQSHTIPDIHDVPRI